MFWLQDAGFGEIAEPFLQGKDVPEENIDAALAALPARYQEAVKKRVATLKDTVSTRLKKNKRPDIRSIFVEEVRASLGVKPDSFNDLTSITVLHFRMLSNYQLQYTI